MIRSFYLNKIVYYIAGSASVIFLLSYFLPNLFRLGWVVLLLLGITVLVDFLLVYSRAKGILAERILPERFSMGDTNKVIIQLENHYGFAVKTSVIDELPVNFQNRNWIRKIKIDNGGKPVLEYLLRPVYRGEYVFNDINVYVHGPLLLVKRRYIFPAQRMVKVYPSYIQMRRYQLLAVSNRLQEVELKESAN